MKPMQTTTTPCLLLAAALFAPLATAQNHTVVPAAYTSDDAIAFNWLAGASRNVHQQILVGPSHLAGLVGTSLTAIELRRTAADETYAPGSCQMTVTLSIAPHAPLETRSALAQNVGPTPVQVFSGTVAFPSSPPELGPSVAWDADNVVRIPFSTPFAYAGGTLCIDVQGTAVIGQEANWWMVDAMFEDVPGTTNDLGGGCGSYGGPTRSWSHVDERSLVVGGYVHMHAFGDPFGLAIAAIGQKSTTGTPLWMLGFNAAPSCELHLSTLDALLPAVFLPDSHPSLVSRGGRADVYLHVPSNPLLLGVTLATQWLDWNQTATSNAIEWSLAAAMPTLDMSLVEADPADTTGNVTAFIAPVLRFEHQ